MKKIVIPFLVIVFLAGVSGYFYWQKNKQQFVKNILVKTMTKLSDSLYSLQFDSSLVDEMKGDAYFGNVVIKSDSSSLLNLKTLDILPDLLIEITIKSITAKGINIALAMKEKKNIC